MSDHPKSELDYCWMTSSQHAANLYNSGVKLWRPEDLLDIEQQLAHSSTLENFTLRSIDGSVVRVKNPMYGMHMPIWKPHVHFQEYWRLVSSTQGPPETYNCTYVVKWRNTALRDYEGPRPNLRSLFDAARAIWEGSTACAALKSRLHELLSRGGPDADGERAKKRVTKVVCFGLGDLNKTGPRYSLMQHRSLMQKGGTSDEEKERESSVTEVAFINHAMALTIAAVASTHASREQNLLSSPDAKQQVRLLTQDIGYTNETRSILQETGAFEVVGKYGAGGFAEVDDESIVFAPFVGAPVRQIVEDIARPVAMIYPNTGRGKAFIEPWPGLVKLLADPESPRTKKMRQSYETWDFPRESDSAELEGQLHLLEIHGRIDGHIPSKI